MKSVGTVESAWLSVHHAFDLAGKACGISGIPSHGSCDGMGFLITHQRFVLKSF